MTDRYGVGPDVVLHFDAATDKPAVHILCDTVEFHDYVDNMNGNHMRTMRRDYPSYFPPRRKLRWLFFGLACAACLMILHQFTAGRTHNNDINQIRPRNLGPDVVRTPDRTVDGSARRENIVRKNFVKDMMRHAWSNYAKYAWGANELRPLSRVGFAGSAAFGGDRLGMTIVDSLDTLYLMGLHEELANATEWIRSSFNIRNSYGGMSVFEANIRFLGGFLAIHALTGKKIFLEKAIDVANALLPAFNSDSGLPWSLINPNSGRGSLYTWLPQECVFLADVGTLHLEFSYLAEITGNAVYLDKVKKVRQLLKHSKDANGLYSNLLDIHNINGSKCPSGNSVSMGAFGDSFYEYLSKAWHLSGKTDIDAKTMFYEGMKAFESRLLHTTDAGLKYFAKMEEGGSLKHEMEHLGCFIGGLYALSAHDSDSPERWMNLAEGLTLTCRLSYNSTLTGIGPEVFNFNSDGMPKVKEHESRQYSLRPEVVESYFYLWKLTGDEKYRDWAWDAAQAIEKTCRKKNGYTGISDVDGPTSSDNNQQSYFMAETLKYLYLTFSDTDPVPLDTWVFNTEAHPLPVIGSKPFRDSYLAWRGIEFSPLHTLYAVRKESDSNDRLLAEQKNQLPEFGMRNSLATLSCRLAWPASFSSIIFVYLVLNGVHN